MNSDTTSPTAPWLASGAELTEMLNQIDAEEFNAVKMAFTNKQTRWFFSGQGRSGLSAAMVAMRVMHIGRECHLLGEATCPAVRQGDAIIFFSGSGATPVTVSFATIAQTEGALIIAVTSQRDSPLAQLADHILTIPSASSAQIGRNLFEQGALIVMDSLIAAVGMNDHKDPNAALFNRHTNMQ